MYTDTANCKVTVHHFMHFYQDKNVYRTVVSTQKGGSPMSPFVPAKIIHKAELLHKKSCLCFLIAYIYGRIDTV